MGMMDYNGMDNIMKCSYNMDNDMIFNKKLF